ncbi:MAG: SAM-dependent chlorinase/fluorinase [Reichenbachiella sp.]
MAIVTFLSDFGLSDHYVAAVKASMLKENPQLQIIDITHQIMVGDIGHAAHSLKSIYQDFPNGTVHLIGVSNINRKGKSVAVKMDGHFFVGDDSGIYSLLTEEPPVAIVETNAIQKLETPFPCRDIDGPIACKLASGTDIQELGPSLEELQRYVPARSKATKKQIAGNVIRIDHYGNLITNIMQHDFESIIGINNHCPFEVNFRREKISKIHKTYFEVLPGECFVLFNTNGQLEIGILQGNGANLLGLMIDDQVFIDFKI